MKYSTHFKKRLKFLEKKLSFQNIKQFWTRQIGFG